jgi:hypothetical protein
MYKRIWFRAALPIIALVLSIGFASAQNLRCEVESPTGDVWITPERCIDLRRGAVAPYKADDVQSLSGKVSPRSDSGVPEKTIITPSEQESHQTGKIRCQLFLRTELSDPACSAVESVGQRYFVRITLHRVHHSIDVRHRYHHATP